MEDLKAQLEDAQEQLNQWLDQIQQSYINLGQLLMEVEDVEESFQEPIKDFQTQWEQLQADFDRLNDIGQKIQHKDEEIDKNQAELKELRVYLEGLYEDIGRESFMLHKQGQLNDPGYGPVFEKLYQLEDKIHTADNDLYQIRSGVKPKNLWKRLNRSFQEKAKQTQKKMAGDTLEKQFLHVGEILMGFNFFETQFQELLPQRAEQFENNRQKTEKYSDKLKALEKDKDDLQKELGEENRNVPKVMKELDHRMDDLQEELDQLYLDLGRHYWENKKIPQALQSQKDTLDTFLRNSDESKILIEKIQQQILLSQLDEQQDGWIKKKEKKEQQIKILQTQLKEMEKSVSSIGKEKKKVEKAIDSLSKKMEDL